jgi:arginase
MNQDKLHLIGYASGIAGVDVRCGEGPINLQSILDNKKYSWNAMLKPELNASIPIEQSVRQLCESLATQVSQALHHRQRLVVLGGDHSCAIGTWSGVYDALHASGDVGLIWVDAHMDSHTPETTHTGRIHGMPMACLLGHGLPMLTRILHAAPKVKPENVCLIGARSFEEGEAALLQRLNVKVYLMDEVKQRGFETVWEEAVLHVNRHTIGFGISLDLDGLDPHDAPGVDVPVLDGIRAKEMGDALSRVADDPRLVVTEIVEFDPARDYDRKTEKLIVSFIEHIAKGKPHDG